MYRWRLSAGIIQEFRRNHNKQRKVLKTMADVRFITPDLDKLKERMAADKPQRGPRTPVVWLTFKNGEEFKVRILPPWTTEGKNAYSPYLKIYQHWDVGPEGRRVICPHMISNKTLSCYICEQVEALLKTGDKNDERKAKKMRAGQSFIYQIIDRGDPVWLEREDAVKDFPQLIGRPKIKFMRLPYSGHSQILGYYNDAEYTNISHHLDGVDLKINRTGEGLNTEYGVKAARDNTPLFGTVGNPDWDMISMISEDMYNLDEHPFFRIATYDETCAIYLGEEVPKQSESKYVPQGAAPKTLPPAVKDDYATWVAEAQAVWIDGKAGVPRTVQGVAEAYGVSVSQVADCFGTEADHTIEGCWECPLHSPCACTYKHKTGKWSESESETQAPATPPLTGIIGGRSAKTPRIPEKEIYAAPPELDEASDNDVSAMIEYLENK